MAAFSLAKSAAFHVVKVVSLCDVEELFQEFGGWFGACVHKDTRSMAVCSAG